MVSIWKDTKTAGMLSAHVGAELEVGRSTADVSIVGVVEVTVKNLLRKSKLPVQPMTIQIKWMVPESVGQSSQSVECFKFWVERRRSQSMPPQLGPAPGDGKAGRSDETSKAEGICLPLANDGEVVLDALVVDELVRLKVGHGHLGCANVGRRGRKRPRQRGRAQGRANGRAQDHND